MRIQILGSAAGGGFPQWNCGCGNCVGIRKNAFSGKARTQAQLALSADGSTWFLAGASPDLAVFEEVVLCCEINSYVSAQL